MGRRRVGVTVTFLCVTRGPAARMRALLELVRPYVDEVVIAADARGDPEVLDWCADLADVRLRFPSARGFSHVDAWALQYCAGEWILRLDDDEAPSAAMLDALPALTRDRGIVEFAFTRHWLWPDARTYLDATPWREEHQRRLFRNLPGLRPPPSGRVHGRPIMLGPRRILALAIHHLDLLVEPHADRLAKARRYEHGDGVAFNAFPVNGMYLPEAAGELPLREVDPADRPLIDHVLSGAGPPAGAPAPGPVLNALPQDLEDVLAGRPDDAVAGTLAVVAADAVIPPAVTLWWEVDARNDGPGTWPWQEAEHPRVRIGSRVRDAAGAEVTAAWAPLTEPVPSGASTRVLVPVETPAAEGDHVVAVDLVVAGREWLDGGPRLPVRVSADAPLARSAAAVRAALSD